MVKQAPSAPDRGDIVWVDFTPKPGHEQAGRRPALVLSPKAYNAKTHLMIVCPITSQVKGYPFEVLLTDAGNFRGAVLSDQIRTLDWQARNVEVVGRAPKSVIIATQAKLRLLVLD